jgi:hypothetical protein
MAATTNNIGNVPSQPMDNGGYNPEANVGVSGLNQFATQVATANQTDSGGGGTRDVSPTRTNAPIFTPKAASPKTAPITNTPIQPDTPAASTTAATAAPTTPTPPKQVELPIPIYDGKVMTRPVDVHPERYTVGTGEWSVSAKAEGLGDRKEITPIVFQKGSRPDLKPVLKANGIVVKAGPHYLISPETLAVINESRNPHYDITENGRVLNAPMGRTIPIIEVNIGNLEASGSRRDIVNGFAGVKSVDYIYESEQTIAGIPVGIVDQINYTINEALERPEDGFDVYRMALTADYSIEKLTLATMQEEGKLDKTKLETFIKGVSERLAILRKDFNIVKSIFYTGVVNPADVVTSVRLVQRASSDTTEEEITRPETANYSITTSTVISTLAPTGSNTTTPPTPTGNGNPASTPSGTVVTSTGTINTSGGQNAALIGQWAAYGWTPAESNTIKSAVSANRIIWSPTLCAKARVVGIITKLGTNTAAANTMMAQLGELYGTGLTITEYIALNNGRKAEVWELGQQIKELDNTNGGG